MVILQLNNKLLHLTQYKFYVNNAMLKTHSSIDGTMNNKFILVYRNNIMTVGSLYS